MGSLRLRSLRVLCQVPFFSPDFRSEVFLRAVAQVLRPRTYNPNVVIVHQVRGPSHALTRIHRQAAQTEKPL